MAVRVPDVVPIKMWKFSKRFASSFCTTSVFVDGMWQTSVVDINLTFNLASRADWQERSPAGTRVMQLTALRLT